jgi:hypothetical protein
MQAKITALEKKISRIKAKLMKLGDLRPGSVSKQMNVCGTPGCACKTDPAKRHGPYYSLSYRLKGRSSSCFVRREEVDVVREQTATYARLRALVADWIELGTELSVLRLHAQRKDQPKTRRRRS